MTERVTLGHRPLQLRISESARKQLAGRAAPLLLELELYFSCLIRKRVHVRESLDGDGIIPVTKKLALRFRPVVTRTCAINDCKRDNPPIRTIPAPQCHSWSCQYSGRTR